LRDGIAWIIQPLRGFDRMRILIIEDDALIGRALVRAFESLGAAVDIVRNGVDGLAALQSETYSAALLDLGLPQKNGLELLRELRDSGNATPVLIVTARDDVETRIAGLDLGADDFVIKPFDFEELAARMRAVLRRHAGHASSEVRSAEITLNLASREITFGGITQVLPAREYALLRALMERPGTILSRAQLEGALYGWGDEVESNAVDVLIYYIRRKFGKDIIKNVRGIGWMVPK
jgi:DNA-binding response OmpR family regulator